MSNETAAGRDEVDPPKPAESVSYEYRADIPRFRLEQSVSDGKPDAHFRIHRAGDWVRWLDVEQVLNSHDELERLYFAALGAEK